MFSDESVKDLIKKRGVIKRKFTLFIKHVQSLEPDVELTNMDRVGLENRCSKMDSIFEAFSNIQDEIETRIQDTDEKDLERELIERESFENMFYDFVSKAKCILTKSKAKHLSEKPSCIKLPTISLPVFDGTFEQWLEFRDTYISLIHDSNTIDDIQKFHYLRSALTGNARQIIKSLQFSAENYAIAWELLENRYNNNRLLVHNHVKALFTTPSINKESSFHIRKLIDNILKNVRALQSLGEPTESWDTLIIYLIVSKLDPSTELEWEEYKSTLSHLKSTDRITLNDLIKFLTDRADVLETIKVSHNSNKTASDIFPKRHLASSHSGLTTRNNLNKSQQSNSHYAGSKRYQRCTMCNSTHSLYACSKFINLSITDRLKFVDEKNLCKNCMRAGHTVTECWFGPCKQCNRKHNSLLHDECSASNSASVSRAATIRLTAAENSGQRQASESNTGHSTSLHSNSTLTHQIHNEHYPLEPVLLSTAMIDMVDSNNKLHTIRAILDNGSQNSFISKSLCDKLQTRLIQSTVRVTGVGNSITQSTQSCEVQVRSKVSDFSMRLNCLVLPCITATLPSINNLANNFCIPRNIQLADPKFYCSNEIDLLIGADKFWELLNDGLIQLSDGPYLQNTKLGWVISGVVHRRNLRINQVHCHFTQTLDFQLRKFWELEEITSNSDNMSDEERSCEKLFLETTKRDTDGRFCVRMPLRESCDQLGDSFILARNRFFQLERKLSRSTPSYKKLYIDFMREYLELGHMTKIDTYPNQHYFLPHHGVFREQSTTTKLRVVFDASAKTTSGKSLNDIQSIGPSLQNDIFAILLRLRQHRYVACADVEKFFRQILIQSDQQYLQLILWRENPADPLGVYRLNTVTYGTASAPYLSMRCLRQLASEHTDDVISDVIMNQFYADDLISSSDNKNELLDICSKVSNVLQLGCFPLRKWLFNFDVPTSNSLKTLELSDKDQSKTLGLGWDATADNFYYTTKIKPSGSHVSKRIMLSITSQLYDPLGLLAPTVVIGKMLLQKLWLYKIGWDDPVPHDILIQWQRFINTFCNIENIQIPRHVVNSNVKRKELHIFTDASKAAYGACAYVRACYDNNVAVSVRLLTSKSKVAPVSPVTIPRLELCGALMGAKLYDKIQRSLSLTFDGVFFWSDSTIVLGWLRMLPSSLKTFVQNRTAEINRLTNDLPWLYVSSKNNPADLVSRGLGLDVLCKSDIWWHGPAMLREYNAKFLQDSCLLNRDCNELPDIARSTKILLCQNNLNSLPFGRFSCFNRMRRVYAFILRFIYNIRSKINPNRRHGPLSVEELNNATMILTRLSQNQSFSDIYPTLNKKISSKLPRNISGLNIFLDDNDIIRVGGRLKNSFSFSYEKKHPILLCSKHSFTRLLFQYEHKQLLHAGPQLLLATIRDTWWPLRGRNLARQIVRNCVTCTRIKGKGLSVQMGNLPKARIEPGFAFQCCGVDYAGPLFILNRKGRGAKLIKCYVCLFVCFTTRAVHLELVTDLTTDAYILALKRFISRRGKPYEINSDNGRNFVGAEKELSQFLKNNSNNIIEYASNDGIKFNFIPPYSPHFGGLWEAGIKSCKHHIRRVIGNAHLTYEEFSTALSQIEAVLNSRPMYPLSTDPNDLLPLSPALFLIGRPLTTPASPDLADVASSRLSRYARVEQIRQQFWKRWSKEYVSELQIRSKWKSQKDDILPNTLVIIKEDNLPPLKWRLGRVLNTFVGKDGVSRVADIKTATGIIQRTFPKICPLFPPEDTSS